MNEILDINLSLPAHIINAGKQVAALIDQRLEAVGLSNARLWALQSIVASGQTDTTVTVTCLADFMNTTKSNVTAMVDRLIVEGLVTRRHNDEDRRTVIIALTQEGERRYQAGVAIVRAFHAELCDRFTPDEQRILSCLLDKLPTG